MIVIARLGDVHLGEPPAVAFHVLGDDGRLTTHYRVVVGRR
ncbi:hypothetical protein [Streptomyces yangpuensis]|nr:hypothetical protein [Streptomyces yangpuensis]